MRLICAYHNCLYLKAYRLHLADMTSIGFDTVVLCVPESYVTFSLAAVRDLIRATHDAGLELWADPWGYPGFDGEALHSVRAAADPEAALVCWLDALAHEDPRARPDQVFWDNPFPADPARLAGWAARAAERRMGSIACLSADRHVHELRRFYRVARLPGVEGIGCDPYCLGRNAGFDVAGHVGTWAGRMARVGRFARVENHVWVQAFNVQAGHEDLPVRAIRAAVAAGVSGLGVWSYGGCWPNSHRPANPETVWRRIGRCLRSLNDEGRGEVDRHGLIA